MRLSLNAYATRQNRACCFRVASWIGLTAVFLINNGCENLGGTVAYMAAMKEWQDDAAGRSGKYHAPSRSESLNEGEISRIKVGSRFDAVAFSGDGRYVFCSTSDLSLYEMATGNKLRTFQGGSGLSRSVSLSYDGSRAAAEHYKDVLVWDTNSGALLCTLNHPAFVEAVAISTDGRRILSAARDALIRVWDVEAAKEILEFSGYNKNITKLLFSPDSTRALSFGQDVVVRYWDLNSGKELFCFERKGVFRAISPDGYYAASSDAKLWNLEAGRVQRQFGKRPFVFHSAAFSSDGKRLLGGFYQELYLMDTADGKLLHTFRGHIGTVFGVAFSADGKRAYSASGDSYDETVSTWDVSRWSPNMEKAVRNR